MNWRTTLVLLAAVLTLGAFIALYERRTPSSRELAERARRALTFAAGRADFLGIEVGAMRIECAREQDRWWLTHPLRARADGGAVDRILAGLAELPKGEVITADQLKARGLSPADYGFEPPRAVFTVGEGPRRWSFRVGRDAPLGGTLYIREDGSDTIVATSTNLLGLLPGGVTNLRDRVLFACSLDEVRRLELRGSGGFIKLVRGEGGGWALQQPLAARADRDAVRGLIEPLLALRVRDFVSDAAVDAAAFGLDDAADRVTLETAEKGSQRSLLLGRGVAAATNLVYAKLQSEESVYTVPAGVRAVTAVRVDDLRDRRLVTLSAHDVDRVVARAGDRALELRREPGEGWWVVQPRRWRADARRVEDLVRLWCGLRVDRFADPAATDLAALGLEHPFRTLELGRAAQADGGLLPGSAAATGVVLRIGNPDATAGLLWVKADGEAWACEVTNAVLEVFPVDPLLYRDRDVLNLPPESIVRIAVAQAEREEVVERDDTGVFHVRTPSNAVPDTEAITDILMVFNNLRAVNYVADNPADLSVFGLDAPRAVVSLGLRGEAGPGKALLLGHAVGGGALAMLRGQDVVFAIDAETEIRLLRALALPPAQPGETSVDRPTSTVAEP